MRLIVETYRRRWVVTLDREDRAPDSGDPQPRGDVYTQAILAHQDGPAEMDRRRTGFGAA